MATLDLDPGFVQHPKVKRLEARYGPLAGMLPIRLWCWTALVHADTGVLKYTQEEVAACIGVTVEQVGAMIDVGFIDQLPSGEFRVHDWDEHEGHLMAFKRRAREAAAARWGSARAKRMPPPHDDNHTDDDLLEAVKDAEKAGRRERFTPPTADEALAYAREIAMPNAEREAEKFRAFYASKAWHVGRERMVDWRGAMRGWKLRAEERAPTNGGSDDLQAEIKKIEKRRKR